MSEPIYKSCRYLQTLYRCPIGNWCPMGNCDKASKWNNLAEVEHEINCLKSAIGYLEYVRRTMTEAEKKKTASESICCDCKHRTGARAPITPKEDSRGYYYCSHLEQYEMRTACKFFEESTHEEK